MRIKQSVGILAITGSKNKHTIGSGRDGMLVPLKSLYTFFGTHFFLWQSVRRWGIMELPINDFSTKSQPDNILLVARPRARRSVSWAGSWRDQPPLPGHRPTAPFCVLLACGIFRGCRVGHDYRNHPLHSSRRFRWRWRLCDNGNHSHHLFFDCVGRVGKLIVDLNII